MIWPILFVTVFVILAWEDLYGRWSFTNGFLDYFTNTLLLVLISGLVACFGIGVGYGVGVFVPRHWMDSGTAQLVSLRNNDGINGSFFLGTGNIGTSQYYFFHEKAGQGYRPGKILADGYVTVFEEKREGGQLKIYTSEFVNPLFQWIALGKQGRQKFEFVIPEGSLKKDFVLQ